MKAFRTHSKIDYIHGFVAEIFYNDCGHSWLGLLSLIMYWIFFICYEEVMFKNWLNSIYVKRIKNPFKDQWYCWICCWSWSGLWMFLTSVRVFDDDLDYLEMLSGNFVVRHQKPSQRLRIFLELMRIREVPDWCLWHWWHSGSSLSLLGA